MPDNPTLALLELGDPPRVTWYAAQTDDGWVTAFMEALTLHEITGLPVRIIEVTVGDPIGTFVPLCQIHTRDGTLHLSPLVS